VYDDLSTEIKRMQMKVGECKTWGELRPVVEKRICNVQSVQFRTKGGLLEDSTELATLAGEERGVAAVVKYEGG
jgi:hypothetical protein